MLFLETRRKVLEYFLNEGKIAGTMITGKAVINKYRQMKKEIFCPGIFRDDLYEKFWLIGYEVGYKQAMVDDETDIPQISAPANALSRMCGEIANLYQDGYLKKLGRGIYMADNLPVSFPKSSKKKEFTGSFVNDAKKIIDVTKIATDAATAAIQEALKKN